MLKRVRDFLLSLFGFRQASRKRSGTVASAMVEHPSSDDPFWVEWAKDGDALIEPGWLKLTLPDGESITFQCIKHNFEVIEQLLEDLDMPPGFNNSKGNERQEDADGSK